MSPRTPTSGNQWDPLALLAFCEDESAWLLATIRRLVELESPTSDKPAVDLVAEGSSGGGSDGNFTAARGVPTIDGLGAVGDGAHPPHEHVLVEPLAWRAALIAGLVARVP